MESKCLQSSNKTATGTSVSGVHIGTRRDRRRRRQERLYILVDATLYSTTRVITEGAAGKVIFSEEYYRRFCSAGIKYVYAIWPVADESGA